MTIDNAWDEKWSEWIEYMGGGQPVPDNTVVQLKYKKDEYPLNQDGNRACNYSWGESRHQGCYAYRYKIKEPESESMRRGKTEAETLAINGWKVGDILEGDEGNGPDRILITAIGEDCFTCKWDYKCTGEYQRESGNTTLSCREWRKVGYRAELCQPEVTAEEDEAWQAKEQQDVIPEWWKGHKQARYLDANGRDWIDEFAEIATIDEFRGAMRFTIGKYNRRAGKKDELVKEIEKMRDYCDRWIEYERSL